MVLKIVSLNVDSLSSNRKREYFWRSRRQNVLEMFHKTKPTIFCLQEACEQNIADIVSEFNHDFECYVGEANINDSIVIYNPIFWSKEYFMLKNGCVCLSTNLEKNGYTWDSESDRSLTWVLLLNKIEKHRILIFNTHLDNTGTIARIRSSEIIVKYIKQLTSMYCCDAILMGDFNSRPWHPNNEEQSSYGSQIIPGCLPTDKIHHIYIEAGFIDSFIATGNNESLTTNTYHDYLGNRFPGVALRIDWQMLYLYEYSKNMVRSYSLYNEKILSDHYPLVCEYQIQTSLEDALYSGKNPVIKMCEFGYAQRHISRYIRSNIGDKRNIIEQILFSDFYTLIDSFSGRKKRMHDIPTYNAVVQNGVVRYYDGTKSRYIIKSSNPIKRKTIQQELEVYQKLYTLFPEPVYIGKILSKRVYFKITPPVKYSSSYCIMKSSCGTPLDQIIYENSEEFHTIVEILIRIFDYLLTVGFVYCDLSPRNTIVEIDESEIILSLIDFEKSYISESTISKKKKMELYRGQAYCEELAVMLTRTEFRAMLDDKCNPDIWSFESKIMDHPFRPEIDQLLDGRGLKKYTFRDYNRLEIEVWNVINANSDYRFFSCKFPGRAKFKIAHYLGCLGYVHAADYERKITELYIFSKRNGLYDKTVCLLSFLIGLLEEKILISYLFDGTIEVETNKNYADTLTTIIDQMLICNTKNELQQRLNEIENRIESLYWGDNND